MIVYTFNSDFSQWLLVISNDSVHKYFFVNSKDFTWQLEIRTSFPSNLLVSLGFTQHQPWCFSQDSLVCPVISIYLDLCHPHCWVLSVEMSVYSFVSAPNFSVKSVEMQLMLRTASHIVQHGELPAKISIHSSFFYITKY